VWDESGYGEEPIFTPFHLTVPKSHGGLGANLPHRSIKPAHALKRTHLFHSDAARCGNVGPGVDEHGDEDLLVRVLCQDGQRFFGGGKRSC
jgi:hypothetical protein